MLVYLHYKPLIHLLIHCAWQHIFGLSAEFSAVLVHLYLLSPVYLEEDEALEEAIQRSLLEEFDGSAVQTLRSELQVIFYYNKYLLYTSVNIANNMGQVYHALKAIVE